MVFFSGLLIGVLITSFVAWLVISDLQFSLETARFCRDFSVTRAEEKSAKLLAIWKILNEDEEKEEDE